MQTEFMLMPASGEFDVEAIEAYLRTRSESVFLDDRPPPNPNRSGNRWVVCGNASEAAQARRLVAQGGSTGGFGLLQLQPQSIHGSQQASRAVVEEMRQLVKHISSLQPLRLFGELHKELTDQGLDALFD